MFDFEHSKSRNAGRKTVGLAILSAAVLLAGAPLTPASALEDAKWFVLRHDRTGDCWAEQVAEIDGAYQRSDAQNAGGPYDTQEQAQAREKALEAIEACNAEESNAEESNAEESNAER